MVNVGQAAPDFTLKGHDGAEVSLSGLKGGKAVILSVYPAAFTGG